MSEDGVIERLHRLLAQGVLTRFGPLFQIERAAGDRVEVMHRFAVAVSGDGRWVMAANDLPHTLAPFDADLNLVKTYAATTLDGKASSRVSAVYDAAPRQSFVVALKDMAELWEISYNPKAEPIFDGYVHDYKMGEAIAKPGFLGVKRTQLDEPLDDLPPATARCWCWTLPRSRKSSACPCTNPWASTTCGTRSAALRARRTEGAPKVAALRRPPPEGEEKHLGRPGACFSRAPPPRSAQVKRLAGKRTERTSAEPGRCVE